MWRLRHAVRQLPYTAGWLPADFGYLFILLYGGVRAGCCSTLCLMAARGAAHKSPRAVAGLLRHSPTNRICAELMCGVGMPCHCPAVPMCATTISTGGGFKRDDGSLGGAVGKGWQG